jgi:hypothetical protein
MEVNTSPDKEQLPSNPGLPGAMFGPSDYVSFMVSVFVLGGLIALPLIYGAAVGLDYESSMPWSAASCAAFSVALRRNGTISWARAAIAIVCLVLAAQIYTTSTGAPAFGAGGMFGFLILAACGYLGIMIDRLFPRDSRRHELKASSDRPCQNSIGPTTFRCWRCKAELEVEVVDRGKRVKCSSCGTLQDGPL